VAVRLGKSCPSFETPRQRWPEEIVRQNFGDGIGVGVDDGAKPGVLKVRDSRFLLL
jgi:hypothetical protein